MCIPRNTGPDRTQEAIDLLAEMSKVANIDIKSLKAREPRYQVKEAVNLRKAFIKKGRELGIKMIEIGIAIDRDYTTVSYHANGSKKRRKVPPWKGRTNEQRLAHNRAERILRERRKELNQRKTG